MPTLPKVDNTSIHASNLTLIRLVGVFLDYQAALNGLSNLVMSQMVGCSRQAIYNTRKGLMNQCSLSFLSRIAGAFGLTLIELIDEARRVEAEGL